MFYSELYEEILSKPYSRQYADTLYIISGYASPSIVIRQLKEFPNLKINLLIGMVKAGGINLRAHKSFQKIAVDYGDRFVCRYINTDAPVHSKIYIWVRSKDSGTPLAAYMGSANYSMKAFSRRQQEVLSKINPVSAYVYYCKFIENSINCIDSNAVDIFSIQDTPQVQSEAQEGYPFGLTGEKDNNAGRNCISLDLTIKKEGEIIVPERSGLNWGQREGREQNQAYIPIRSSIYKTNFFPERGIPFIIHTDDNQILDCVTAQDNGKALETYRNNSDLGLYFRRRLGVAPGRKVYLSDLDAYGRRDVTICKIDDETYFLDFTPE